MSYLNQSHKHEAIEERLQRIHVVVKEAQLLDRKSASKMIDRIYKSAPIRSFIKRVYDRIQNKNIPKFRRLYKEFEEKILIPELQRAIKKEILRKHGKEEIAKSPESAATKATARIFGTVNLERIELEGASILKSGYTAAFVDGGDASYRLAGIQSNFDVLKPEAVKAIDKMGSELITHVVDETRKSVKSVVKFGIQNGYSMPKIARDLTMIQSLFPKWAMAVTNYNFKLWQQGVPAARAQELAKRYRDKLIRKRRLMIARTETAIAQSQGSLVGYKSIGVKRVRFFAAHGACPICADMDGTVYRIDEAYGVIPVHPNGRCDWLSVSPRGGYKDPRIPPSKGLSAGIDSAISEIMTLFARRPVEHSATLDDAGNVIFTKSGGRSSIKFYPAELDIMREAGALIHNHPGSSSFSWADVGIAADLNIGRLVVCSEQYRYTCTPAAGKTWNKFAAATLKREYYRLKPKYERMFNDMIREQTEAGVIVTDEMESAFGSKLHLEHSHEAMKNVAKQYGYSYKRESVTGGAQ